jgi:hypothetical protein
MLKLTDHLGRLVILSVAAGALLSQLEINASDLVRDLGLMPETVLGNLDRAAKWAVPKLVLGMLSRW